jgi:hypothetical protein
LARRSSRFIATGVGDGAIGSTIRKRRQDRGDGRAALGVGPPLAATSQRVTRSTIRRGFVLVVIPSGDIVLEEPSLDTLSLFPSSDPSALELVNRGPGDGAI